MEHWELAVSNYEVPIFEYGTNCLICGETVLIEHIRDVPKICAKCKAAVMKVREQDGKID